MRLRAHTVEALSAAAFSRARARIVDALRQSLPAETARYTHLDFEAFCELGVSRARDYGLDTERGAYVYLAAMILYGEDFDIDPRLSRIRAMLENRVVDQEVKGKAIELELALDTGRRV